MPNNSLSVETSLPSLAKISPVEKCFLKIFLFPALKSLYLEWSPPLPASVRPPPALRQAKVQKLNTTEGLLGYEV